MKDQNQEIAKAVAEHDHLRNVREQAREICAVYRVSSVNDLPESGRTLLHSLYLPAEGLGAGK